MCYYIHMKTRTNVTIQNEIFEAAKAHNLVLSQILEEALKKELSKIKKKEWEEENRQSIEAYNEQINKNGVFSDGMRPF